MWRCRYSVVGKGGLIREVALDCQLANRLEELRFAEPETITDSDIYYLQHYDIGGGKQCKQFMCTQPRIQQAGLPMHATASATNSICCDVLALTVWVKLAFDDVEFLYKEDLFLSSCFCDIEHEMLDTFAPPP